MTQTPDGDVVWTRDEIRGWDWGHIPSDPKLDEDSKRLRAWTMSHEGPFLFAMDMVRAHAGQPVLISCQRCGEFFVTST